MIAHHCPSHPCPICYLQHPYYRLDYPGYTMPVQQGCICPPGAEQTCQGAMCPRRKLEMT